MTSLIDSEVGIMDLKAPSLKPKAFSITRIDLLVYAALAAIVVFAVAIRLLPLQWGVYLDEFDPYIQYKGAQYIVENGFNAWYTWFDPTRWAPWGASQFEQGLLGTPFTGAATYMFLTSLGMNVSLLDVCAFFPVFAGAIIAVLAFFLGKQLVNRGIGLLTAFVFAVDPTSIQRTALGFFDTESTGMMGMFIALIFFVKSLKSRTIPYAIISGLGMAYMALCWRAFLYPINFIALFVVVMVLMGKWSRRLTTSFTIIASITLFAIIVTPSYGIGTAISAYTVGPIVAVLVCLLRSFTEMIPDVAKRQRYTIGIVLGTLTVFGILTLTGVFGDITGKFLAIINPFSRAGIGYVTTVGEQFPAIWSHFFTTYHVLILLVPVGIIFALRRNRVEDLFVVLFVLTALYGGGSFVRLLILAAPAVAIVAGLALTNLMSRVGVVLRQQVDKKSRGALLSKYYGVFVIAVVMLAMVPVAYDNLSNANRPAMIVSASTGAAVEIPDWIEALAWMHANLPEDTIVASWWDYGYWINVMANLSVVDDNSTWNSTQIQKVAEAFLNNESVSVEIFKTMNASYVVVYEPFQLIYNNPPLALPITSLKGDFEKSEAMMVWIGYNASDYISYVSLGSGYSWPLPAGPKAANTTLYQLLFYPYITGYKTLLNVTITPPTMYTPVFISSNGWVMVYRIL
jgi:dolichyl-diphosphooligosaccharide--protein glycosyltransferase